MPETPAISAAGPITPVAAHIPTKLRANAIQAVKELRPEGNPKGAALEAARAAALALIDSYPEDVNGIEVKIEINSAAAHQIMVIVFPHQL